MKVKYVVMIFLLISIGKYKINKMTKLIPSNVTNYIIPDILISTGGRYASYQLGICHYIKNNFDIKNKKILGFSAGSWNSLFMVLDNKYNNNLIKKIFKIKTKNIKILLKKSKSIIEDYNIDDYDIKNIYIAVSTLNGLIIYNKFISIEEVTRCCTASSFIPYLTYNDFLYFYNNNLSVDGGIYCKEYIKTLPSSTLVISFKMFGRYKNKNIFKECIELKKPSTYQLYIQGYHDACKNHSYFDKFFYSSSYSS